MGLMRDLSELTATAMMASAGISSVTTGLTNFDCQNYEGTVRFVASIGAPTTHSGSCSITGTLTESSDNATFTAITSGTFTASGTAAQVVSATIDSRAQKRYIGVSFTPSASGTNTFPIGVVALASKQTQ